MAISTATQINIALAVNCGANRIGFFLCECLVHGGAIFAAKENFRGSDGEKEDMMKIGCRAGNTYAGWTRDNGQSSTRLT